MSEHLSSCTDSNSNSPNCTEVRWQNIKLSCSATAVLNTAGPRFLTGSHLTSPRLALRISGGSCSGISIYLDPVAITDDQRLRDSHAPCERWILKSFHCSQYLPHEFKHNPAIIGIDHMFSMWSALRFSNSNLASSTENTVCNAFWISANESKSTGFVSTNANTVETHQSRMPAYIETSITPVVCLLRLTITMGSTQLIYQPTKQSTDQDLQVHDHTLMPVNGKGSNPIRPWRRLSLCQLHHRSLHYILALKFYVLYVLYVILWSGTGPNFQCDSF